MRILFHPGSQSPIPSCTRFHVLPGGRMLKEAGVRSRSWKARVNKEPGCDHSQAPSLAFAGCFSIPRSGSALAE